MSHREKSEKLKKVVALQYKPETDVAPKVVAKGQGKVAENLLLRAEESQVSIYEDSNLVESLFGLEIQEEIPEELYNAVAEIIFYVYSMDQKRGLFNESS